MIKQIKRQNPRERLPDEKWTNEFEKAAIASKENTERNKFGRERSDEMKPEWIEKRKTSDFFFDEIEELRNEKDSVHWDQPLYHGLTD